jgi:AraC-like DNA-binding protein/DNA gyrase inhibitor GyrI
MDKRIEKSYDRIKRHYRESLHLTDLADRVGLSPFHFQRLFKREMKESPAACLTRVRLDRAAHLIVLDTTVPLSQIASDCGFSSLSAFSRAFSNRFKMPPAKYKKSARIQHHETSDGPLDVEIIYFEGATVWYEHTSMYSHTLEKEFEDAETSGRKRRMLLTGKRYGIFTHIAFHGPRDRLNYYAGIALAAVPAATETEQIFVIPKGKYAAFETNVPYEDLLEVMMTFKEQWLDSSKYLIRDIFAFEEFLEKEKGLRRRIFVPIKPRSGFANK